MAITKIRIQNFRSIKNQTFAPKDLSIIVGQNDVGKSNYLRALNLFFNEETDPGKKFYFEDDFSHFAETPRGKAKEVVIEITFEPPKTFKNTKEVVWKKSWRQNGFFDESQYNAADKSEISKRTKIGDWLRKIQFKYVPAIKGPEYFRMLMRDLHDTLASTIDTEMRDASGEFVDRIRNQTAAISKTLKSKLKLDSTIQLPSDLGSIFEVLDFQTQTPASTISLQRRGDGIKVRHIPAILKFLADQRNVIYGRGAIKAFTIWGYEEPENNLELSGAFDLASEFLEYAPDIQILMTTHSPAFYSLFNTSQEGVVAFAAKADPTHETALHEISGAGLEALDVEMGLMQLVEPYIRRLKIEREELNKSIKKMQGGIPDQPTIYLEGLTDKNLFEEAAKVFFPIGATFASAKSAGAAWVKDNLIAAVATKPDVKIIGIFDADESGCKAHKEFNEAKETFYPKRQSKTKALRLQPSEHLITIQKKGVSLSISLEEVLPSKHWQYFSSNDWFEPRTECVANNIGLIEKNPSLSLEGCLKNAGLTDDEVLVVMRKVKKENKADVVKYICNLPEAEKIESFQCLERTFRKIREVLQA